MKKLGLDLGNRTLGIAISDELNFLARGLETFRFTEKDFKAGIGLNLDQFVRDNALPYKVYTALLTQTEENDPVATVLENTLGFDVTWYRDNVGFYLFQNNTTGVLFDPDKTWINTPADHTYDNDATPGVYRGSETPVPYLGIITPDDNYLIQYSIEIRVYP